LRRGVVCDESLAGDTAGYKISRKALLFETGNQKKTMQTEVAGVICNRKKTPMR
jgi:hypothetical protein